MKFYITYHSDRKEIVTDEKKSIMSHVRTWFECSFSLCSKRGSCGRCRCRIKRGQELLEALACSTYPEDGDEIECLFEEEISLHNIEALQNAENGLHNAEILQESEISLHNTTGSAGRIAAIDLGSTTIVMGVRKGEDGKVFKLMAANPQRSWGRDVISRLAAASEGDGEKLKKVTLEKISAGLKRLEKGGQDTVDCRITKAVLCCNTSMLHLLMGYDCKALGVYPFIPVSLGGESFTLNDVEIFTLPGSSAFIGSDIIAGLYCVEERTENKSYLYLDLGTNSEIVLKTADGKYYGTSAAAGSAADYVDGINVMGPDLIHMTAGALRAGMLDDTGLMADEYFDSGYEIKLSKNGDEERKYILSQAAVRDIQLMKAAIHTAVDILLNKFGGGRLPESVMVAGAFGYHLAEDDIFRIGMLPQELEGRIKIAGNLAFEGALKIADNVRNDNGESLKELKTLAEKISVVSLPDLSSFGEKYFDSMNFK